jgi:hypothetical protein
MFLFLYFPNPDVANSLVAYLVVAKLDVADPDVANLGVGVSVAVIENESTLKAP